MKSNVKHYIQEFNLAYEKLHKAYEDNFWATKMGLKGNSNSNLVESKARLDSFLGNKEELNKVQGFLSSSMLEPREQKILKIFEKTLKCYIVEDPKLVELKKELDELEAALQEHRNKLELGYHRDGQWIKGSTVMLRNVLATCSNEEERKSAFKSLASIGPHIAEKFCQIIKKRNQLAKKLGFEDFYEMKVVQAEGFGKKKLFQILDDLLEKSNDLNSKALASLKKKKGDGSLEAWNQTFVTSGQGMTLYDPYFPFENAVDCWARSFAALGITYEGATMNLDLCDRDGKYSNGFCHWPQPAWMSENGWIPSRANFTSLAIPSAVGSGKTALETLMHEGGHAAHFANVIQESPLFSQERAPTSVAYAENQSMFLDSLVGDSAWLGRYALSKESKVIPWEIIETELSQGREQKVMMMRRMLAIPYFEKQLYELSEDQVTPENLIALESRVEKAIQGIVSPRPILSVPHIISDESSCYYHGYVLAEMSVHQTRQHFLKKYGTIVDNPNVGKDLKEVYWRPGNSEQFLDLVEKLTGKPLSPDDWINVLDEDVGELISREKHSYDQAVKIGPKFKLGDSFDLNMQINLCHGDLIVSSSSADGMSAAIGKFKRWIRDNLNKPL